MEKTTRILSPVKQEQLFKLLDEFFDFSDSSSIISELNAVMYEHISTHITTEKTLMTKDAVISEQNTFYTFIEVINLLSSLDHIYNGSLRPMQSKTITA